MHVEVVRTFPIARSKGYAFMRDLTRWSSWTPVSVAVDEMAFSFSPMRGITFSGDLAVVDEVPEETCEFVFTTVGFPDVAMTWSFRHAGPGAFTLHCEIVTEPADWWAQVVEAGSFLRPTLRRELVSSLDLLERHFLGEVDLEAPSEPEAAVPA